MKRFVLEKNDYLHRPVVAYYDCAYIKPENSNPKYFESRVSNAILVLKNGFKNESDEDLSRAKNYIRAIATTDLKEIIKNERISNPLVLCVPRSKADFINKQLYFHKAISEAVNTIDGINGIDYIKRVVNTKTTHLTKTRKGDMGGDGELPYPGITDDTCSLMGNVRGRDVILVDDIYTKTVNIDEDCCQFLFDNGVKSVVLYTICKTQMG